MCGIAGIYLKNINKKKHLALDETVKKLMKPINYRGPDNIGLYCSGNICLGHLRLSIIDLSERANQPMIIDNDNIAMTYNGEIYNYLELKDQLKNKYNFKTNSDTEVVLYSYLEWGDNCVNKFNGMWAFTIYNKRENIIFCSRDRMGIKPFYYYDDNDVFVFASEIKCFKELSSLTYSVNINQVIDNMIYGPLSYGRTQIDGIYQLEAGSNLLMINNKLQNNKYFSLENTFELKSKSIDIKHIEYILNDAVKLRLRSDVPIATLNSGGLDSSLLSAIAKKSINNVNTFSVAPQIINGKEMRGDESRFSNIIAEHLKTNHTTIRYSQNDFFNLLNYIIYINDGELYHSNTIPLYLLCKEIKNKGITVIIGGEGADEIFRGYTSNVFYNISRFIPKKLFIRLFQNGRFEDKPYFFNHFNNYRNAISMVGSLYIRKNILLDYYNMDYEMPPERKEIFYIMNNMKPDDSIAYFEQKVYLSAILQRLDRVSMANSLEARVVFLDYRLVELLNRIPYKLKVGLKPNSVKLLLKRIAKKYLPNEIINRRKMGFATPIYQYTIDNTKGIALKNSEKWYFNSINIADGVY